MFEIFWNIQNIFTAYIDINLMHPWSFNASKIH